MDEKFNSILSIVLLPQIVSLIAEREKMGDLAAMNEFYTSKTYELLSEEDTKVWHFSPMAIYEMWKTEKNTGHIIYPEETV